jgi:DNA-binding transcriptional regulator YbjK
MARTNARGAERRAVILRAAVEVVADKGAGALTHRAAAAAAGVSLASVTYHFPSSDDLRRATLAHAAASVGPQFTASLHDGDCGADEFGALIGRWREIGRSNRAAFVTLFSLLVEALHDPALSGDVEALLETPTSALVEVGVPQDMAEAVVSSLIGLALVTLARDAPEDAESRFDRAMAALFAGAERR